MQRICGQPMIAMVRTSSPAFHLRIRNHMEVFILEFIIITQSTQNFNTWSFYMAKVWYVLQQEQRWMLQIIRESFAPFDTELFVWLGASSCDVLGYFSACYVQDMGGRLMPGVGGFVQFQAAWHASRHWDFLGSRWAHILPVWIAFQKSSGSTPVAYCDRAGWAAHPSHSSSRRLHHRQAA